MSRECTHIPRTTLHLSISWCVPCQHWLLHWSQSGRREYSGAIVLIEFLKDQTLADEANGPEELLAWSRDVLQAATELECDRRDTDMLMPSWRLRSV